MKHHYRFIKTKKQKKKTETSLPQLYIIHSWPRYVQHVISSSKGKHSEREKK